MVERALVVAVFWNLFRLLIYFYFRSADFAFTKFSMIKKVLLVLGHWYYQRLATLIHFFFYKNLVLGNIMVSVTFFPLKIVPPKTMKMSQRTLTKSYPLQELVHTYISQIVYITDFSYLHLLNYRAKCWKTNTNQEI